MKRIFISSVQKEFSEIRKLLKRYISKNPAYRRLFDTFVFEEDVVAKDRRADEVYLAELARCDIYLGLIGHEYGFEDSKGISPTEREFDEATRLGLPRLVFVLDGNVFPRHPKEATFLAKISSALVRAKCPDAASLMLEIYAALDGLLVEQGAYRMGPFDASPCEGSTMRDISKSKIREFLLLAKMKRQLPLAVSSPAERVLAHFHLVDDAGIPLNSAILLFGRDPQKWFPTSHVMCVEWPTERRGKPIKDHRIFSGTLFDMADAATSFVLDKLEHWIGVRNDGAVAPTGYDIPRFVVAEAIINGIAHRDYSNTGSLQVELFPDRLVVMSPGAPHPLTDVSTLDKTHKSYPVNPLIADALYQTGHIERLGTGLEELFEQCRAAGLPKPRIEVFRGEFRLTIFRKTKDGRVQAKPGQNNRSGKPVRKPGQKTRSEKPVRKVQERLLELFAAEPAITQRDIVAKLGVARSTVILHIAALKKANLIRRVGPDKGGHWEVVK